MDYYLKTVKALYGYIPLKMSNDSHREDIEYIMQYGLPHKSKSITRYIKGSTRSDNPVEDAVERLEEIEDMNLIIIERIENALFYVSNDRFFEIIPMLFFKQMKREEIAEHFQCDESTITRNKNRLIRKISRVLFPEYGSEIVLNEILGN